MKKLFSLGVALTALAASAASTDPASVVEKWSDASTHPKIIDINFSDTSWPDSWQGETGRDCPSLSDGGYVNAIIDVNANGGSEVKYPVVFHNCTFATNASANGFGGATAAFSRQYYVGEKPAGNSAATYNNWTVAGHTTYLEDNIQRDEKGIPVHGEAGFVQMCRDASADKVTSLHGWMEIDHIPYVERVQWSWSSTSWGRGIKCDIKIGDGEWKPLVWMGSERQKQGWTVFSDQGYFMENVIDARDVSLRWRVWDGEDFANPVQTDENGACPFTTALNPLAQMQAPRVHKVKIFGDEITAEQAAFARENMVNDPGELSDLSEFGVTNELSAPDDNAEIVTMIVAQDGTGDYTKVQDAINAVPAGVRALIYIRPGVYEENIYAGHKGDQARFISLIGENRETTILSASLGMGMDPALTFNDCAAINVYYPRFYAENITIRNTAGENAGQSIALYTNGDGHVLNKCTILSYQDTYKSNSGSRGYFRDCVIGGTVDFIYDSGLEWFDRCEIRARKASKGGYLTAPGTSAMPMSRVLYPELSQPYFYPGLFFDRCELTAEDGVAASSFTLGRPWQENCGAMFLNCTLGKHIAPAGWTAWSGTENSSALYEYRSVNPDGSLADTSKRVSFGLQASDAEVEAYMNPEFLFGNFSKVPFDYEKILRAPAVPAGFHLADTHFTWEADADAAAYLVLCDGVPVAFTNANTFEGYDPAKSYTVKAVSRYGVTSGAAEVEEAARLKAFPTAEGFGKFTSGGRGGRVVTVTSIADDGSEGTLRWAFDQYKNEPITIVFAVSGQIALSRELRVNRNDWTLAGQTAPGEGIAITRNKVNLGGSQNFIVRNVRFRIGNKSIAGDVMMENALGAENCSNFIFDHCSFGWSVEENMNTADSHFLTVQYSIVHEGLYRGGHSKGDRGYGCQWGGSPATYHHNLLAHNQSRSCRFNGARGEDHVVFIEYINNVNYNYGTNGGCYGGENTAPVNSYNGLNSAHECNFINNYYRRGPASNATKVVFVNASGARDGAKSWAPAKWYVAGNVATASAAATADNWSAMTAELYKLEEIKAEERIVPQNAYYKYSITGNQGNYEPTLYMLKDFQTAEDAFNTVVETAGTVNRDKVEARVANDARTGKVTYGGAAKGKSSGIIDTEADAEGFFAYSTDYVVPTDTDGDGMPDEWERANGLDPSTPDQNRRNAEGYTALEVYLNSLMGEQMDNVFGADALDVASIATEVAYDALTRTLTAPETAIGGLLSVYGADGRLLCVARVVSTSTVLPAIPAGAILIRLDAPNAAPVIIKAYI